MQLTMLNLFWIGVGLVTGYQSVTSVYHGLKDRGRHQRITGTSTTNIQDVNSEGTVELKGTISGPVAGNGFISPLTQTEKTVFAKWRVEDYKGDEDGHWKIIATDIDSVPFYLDDGTDQIQVDTGNRYDDVTWKGDAHYVETVDMKSDTPQNIMAFLHEHGLEERTDVSTLAAAAGYGEDPRRYSEWTLEPGDEIYLLGHVQAATGATTPLHPDDAVVIPDEPIILSDLSEDELDQHVRTNYLHLLAFSAGLLVVSVVAFTTALTTVL